MSDEKLRELERRFKETGSVEDEAAWLKERVRVGDLTQERLELAAYCGHEGAILATAGRRPKDNVRSWVRGLSVWGKEPAVRVAVLAVARILPAGEAASASEIQLGLQAARDWLACPCDEHRRLSIEAKEALLQLPPSILSGNPGRVAQAVVHVTNCAATGPNQPTPEYAVAREVATRAATAAARAVNLAYLAQVEHRGQADYLKAVRAALAPWVIDTLLSSRS